MARRPLMKRLGSWLPALVYMAAIFWLSSKSDPLPEVTTRVWDKILHLVEYAGLAVLLCRALFAETVAWPMAVLGAILLTSAYGASDEWHQMFTSLRSADVRDWLADTVGGTMGAVLYGFRRMSPGDRDN